MKDLNNYELIHINGGTTPPNVSNNSSVQSGYNIGYHIGHAIGQTIQDVGSMVSTVGSWIFG